MFVFAFLIIHLKVYFHYISDFIVKVNESHDPMLFFIGDVHILLE